jgi:glyceraldehyde-3-phosphate dehydrogenase (NADP+)
LFSGNTVVLKLPRIGVFCHWPTFELFIECFPKGVVNVLCGSGRATLGPIMKTGKIDILAFIGNSLSPPPHFQSTKIFKDKRKEGLESMPM